MMFRCPLEGMCQVGRAYVLAQRCQTPLCKLGQYLETTDRQSGILHVYTLLIFDTIASQIFITYRNFYQKESEVPSKILFKIPLVNINKKASVFLDAIPDERDDSILQFIIASEKIGGI